MRTHHDETRPGKTVWKSIRVRVGLLCCFALALLLPNCGGGGGGGGTITELQTLTWDQGNWDDKKWQ